VPPRPTDAPASATRRSSRRELPTLTDASDVLSTEETEQSVAESAREPFANTLLPRGAEARLDEVRSPEPGRSHSLTTIRTLVGRGPEADLQVNDPKASRKHASIFFTGSEFRVRDESSVNGTSLNGSKVVEYVIRDGDQLRVGDTVFTFRLGVER
jgi:hypothetical protein